MICVSNAIIFQPRYASLNEVEGGVLNAIIVHPRYASLNEEEAGRERKRRMFPELASIPVNLYLQFSNSRCFSGVFLTSAILDNILFNVSLNTFSFTALPKKISSIK
jgi:hypothetical protein